MSLIQTQKEDNNLGALVVLVRPFRYMYNSNFSVNDWVGGQKNPKL